jgi:MATE family multidrug resistance protein
MRSRLGNWYEGKGGVREVLRVALPLMVSMSSMTIMQFTDRMFLLWRSPADMAGSMSAGVLWFAAAVFPFGLASYVGAFVAQYQGAGRSQRIGLAVWQAIFLCLFCTPPLLATNFVAPAFFESLGHDPAIVEAEIIYYRIMNYGVAAHLVGAALAGFFSGRGATRTVMVVDSSAAALNIILDYAWIFGAWGFPEWGIAGAAWATIVSQWIKAVVYFALFLRPAMQRRFGTLSGCRYDGPLMRRLVYYGAPSGLQMLIEVGGFSAYFMLVGQLGAIEFAATSLAFNINSLAFMPVWGISVATTTLVGQRLGENRPDLATRASWSALAIGFCYMLTFAAVYLLLPDVLLWPHQAHSSPEEFPALRDMTIVLLRFVAFYCIFDAGYMVLAGTLKGAGDTRFVLYSSAAFAAAAVAATWIGLSSGMFGLLGSWAVVTTWVSCLGIAYLLRFLGGKWRDMRVIEPEIEQEPPQAELVAADVC